MTFFRGKTSTKKLAVLTILMLSATVYLSAGYSYAQTDTNILTMQGATWNLKIESQLQTALESKNQPYVSVAKAGSEKELFLTLNSLSDCKTGQIEFKVQTQGLAIYKQLPLDKELTVGEQYDFVNATVAMKKDKVIVSRPENIVNSFACFDSQGKKVMHIYASKLIDAKGNSVWVDSDLKYGLLTVYLDQKFLDSAVFPVVVDPTFGYDTIGTSTEGGSSGYLIAVKFNCIESGTLQSIHFYTENSGVTVYLGLYSDNGGSPNVLLANGSTTSVSNGWCYANMTYSLSATTYWLGYLYNSEVIAHYDSGASGIRAFDNPHIVLENPFPTPDGTDNEKMSIYAYYSTEPSPTPTSTPSPSPTPTPTVTNNIFAGIAILMFMIIIGFVLSLKPYSVINVVYGILVLSVTAGLLLGGYLAGLWFFAFAGVAVGLICLLRGTDLL